MEALEYRNHRAYQHGTAARSIAAQPARPERSTRRAPRQQPKSYKKVQISYKTHPLVMAKRSRAMQICLTVALVFVMAVAVVASNAISAQINLENIDIQENIYAMEEQIEQLNLAISTECDVQQVAEVAENDLSMGFPSDSQVYYVELEQEQAVQQVTVEQESGFFQRVQEWFLGIAG